VEKALEPKAASQCKEYFFTKNASIKDGDTWILAPPPPNI